MSQSRCRCRPRTRLPPSSRPLHGPQVAGGHRLGVERSDGRFRLSPGLAAAPAQQAFHDQMPDAGVAPAAELLPHRRPKWEIAWPEVPVHTGPELVENGVGDPPPQMLLRSATHRRIAWRIKETFDLCPLQVCQVRRISLPKSSVHMKLTSPCGAQPGPARRGAPTCADCQHPLVRGLGMGMGSQPERTAKAALQAGQLEDRP